MKNIHFILASRSPRRQELLKVVLPEFESIPSEFDESELMKLKLSPEELVSRLSFEKAKEVFLKNKDAIVIGGDTVVVSPENIVFGIPQNRKEAFKILSSLSGKTHRVLTGITIYDGEYHTFVSSTEVEFYELTKEEIDSYLDTGEYRDKAGAYGIQGYGSTLVKGIHGDYFNVVGFPVSKFKRELKNFLSKKIV